MPIPRADTDHVVTLLTVILGLLAITEVSHALRVGLWIAFVITFAYWIYLATTERKQRLRLEPNAAKNVLQYDRGPRDAPALFTEAVARFQNPDDKPHVITRARIAVVRRRWGVWRSRITEGDVDGVRPEPTGALIDLRTGLRLEPRSLSPFYVFSTAMLLPRGRKLTRRDDVELRVSVLGQPDLVLPVTSPEIQLE